MKHGMILDSMVSYMAESPYRFLDGLVVAAAAGGSEEIRNIFQYYMPAVPHLILVVC